MNPSVLMLGISLFIWGIGEGMFLLFQPIYLQQLGASPVGIGVILGVGGLFMALASIPAGYLSDRFGARPLIWLSWLIGLAAAGVMALADSLIVFVLGLALYGLTSFSLAPMNSYVTRARGKWSVGRAITLISASFNLGAVSGPIIGGAIGDRYGLKTVFLMATGFMFISTMLIFFIKKQPIERRQVDDASTRLMANMRFWSFVGIILLVMFSLYLPQPLTPNYLQNQRGYSLSVIGRLGSLGNLGNAILALALGALDARLAFLLSQGFVASFTLMLWLGNTPIIFGIGYFAMGGYKVARSMASALARSLVHPAEIGTAYGITETANSVAVFLAPILAGVIYQTNPSGIYKIGLTLILISMIISYILIPKTKNQQISAASPHERRIKETDAT
jgi:MFS family permease